MPSDDVKEDYRQAWERWQQQIAGVHTLLLDGEPLRPDQIKGLLNREERAHQRYEEARRRLLGVGL